MKNSKANSKQAELNYNERKLMKQKTDQQRKLTKPKVGFLNLKIKLTNFQPG